MKETTAIKDTVAVRFDLLKTIHGPLKSQAALAGVSLEEWMISILQKASKNNDKSSKSGS